MFPRLCIPQRHWISSKGIESAGTSREKKKKKRERSNGKGTHSLRLPFLIARSCLECRPRRGGRWNVTKITNHAMSTSASVLPQSSSPTDLPTDPLSHTHTHITAVRNRSAPVLPPHSPFFYSPFTYSILAFQSSLFVFFPIVPAKNE